MYENVKKYAPKVVNILETIEEDKAYRLHKSASYNEQIEELTKEINDLTRKSFLVNNSTKDSIYKKIEDLTIRRIGITQLRDNVANQETKVGAEELDKAFGVDQVTVNKRIQELEGKMSAIDKRLKETEEALEAEKEVYIREQAELKQFNHDIRRQIMKMSQANSN